MPSLRQIPPNSEPLTRLSLSGLEASELVSGGLNADSWQETICDRVAMLVPPGGPTNTEAEHFIGAPAAMVRFVGAFCRVARNAAPAGASKPERVPMLLRLLPILVAPGRSDSLRGARSL